MSLLRTVRHGAVVLLLLALAGCGSSSSDDTASSKAKPTEAPLEGTPWILSASTNLGVPTTGVVVTAEFAAGRVTGNSGCNSYSGPAKTSGSSLTIDPGITSTQMACEAAATAVEQAYLARLPKVKIYKTAGSKLTLSDANDTALLVYEASDGASAIAGNWTATGYYTGTAIQSVVVGSTLTAGFKAGQVSGDSGCNTFGGPYEVNGTKIKMGPFRSTLKACTDPERQTQEQQYTAALELTTTFRVTPTQLELFRADGGIAATFEKTSATG
jgi:heat shock protein HslJ